MLTQAMRAFPMFFADREPLSVFLLHTDVQKKEKEKENNLWKRS